MIPPDANAGFVAAMEDVLETYQKPRDPDRPLVCLDETSKQLIVETRAPIPAKPGQPARHDYEYERNGVANLFMMFAPLEGWRHVKVTDRHAAVDYAQVLKELSDLHFPDADKIVLVQDNLSTHTTASLYAAFPAPEARRLANRFEWHYTPKHGSWLDMAESELAVLTSQCLSRRIPDKPTLEKEVAAWERHRNKHHAKADWQFTTENARVKLKRLSSPIRMTRATRRWRRNRDHRPSPRDRRSAGRSRSWGDSLQNLGHGYRRHRCRRAARCATRAIPKTYLARSSAGEIS